MDAKLTLKLDKQVIDEAKKYATSHKRSLSRMIESYLKSLSNQGNAENNEDFEISPFIKSMSSGVNVPADVDYKSEYFDHKDEKYK